MDGICSSTSFGSSSTRHPYAVLRDPLQVLRVHVRGFGGCLPIDTPLSKQGGTLLQDLRLAVAVSIAASAGPASFLASITQ